MDDSDPESKDNESLTHLIQAGADIAGGATGAAVGLLIAGPVGAVAGGLAGPSISHTLQKIGREISKRLLGKRR
jgi:outer membrane lipoprotein SlyB